MSRHNQNPCSFDLGRQRQLRMPVVLAGKATTWLLLYKQSHRSQSNTKVQDRWRICDQHPISHQRYFQPLREPVCLGNSTSSKLGRLWPLRRFTWSRDSRLVANHQCHLRTSSSTWRQSSGLLLFATLIVPHWSLFNSSPNSISFCLSDHAFFWPFRPIYALRYRSIAHIKILSVPKPPATSNCGLIQVFLCLRPLCGRREETASDPLLSSSRPNST